MPRRKLLLTYVTLIGLPLAILAAVLAIGRGMNPNFAALPLGDSHPAGSSSLILVVSQIAVILAIARLVGFLFRRIGQPQVVGEMLAGILLGPSFFGWLFPAASAALFPAASLGLLGAVSQLGLILFMFLVGLELNAKELYEHGQTTVLISHVSIVAPFALGSILALYLYPRLSDGAVGFTGFALFMGTAMAITAFPVLARILADRRLLRTRLGTIAIACAAVDDVTGWLILAYVVAVIRASQAESSAVFTLLGLVLFLAAMFTGVRRLAASVGRQYERHGHLRDDLLAAVLLLALLSALSTEALGLHLLFGAFLAGAIMPKDPRFVAYLTEKFETVAVLFLLPVFFAVTGLRTRIGLVSGGEMWFYCGLIILVAIAGKFGGAAIAARVGGLGWRPAFALGALMNTRGLMELVVLNIGLDLKVISPALFSMMVVMALVTTLMTAPLLKLIRPSEMDLSAAEGVGHASGLPYR